MDGAEAEASIKHDVLMIWNSAAEYRLVSLPLKTQAGLYTEVIQFSSCGEVLDKVLNPATSD